MALVPGTAVTSANANTTTNTSLVVTLGSTTIGNLNVVEISGLANGLTINPTMTTPAGWTKVGEIIDTAGTPASWVGVYYRFFQSGDASTVTFSWTNQGQMVAICTPYAGVDTTTPVPYSVFDFKNTGGNTATSDANYFISGTTSATAGRLVYGFANRTGGAWTPAADTTRGQVTLAASSTMIGQITAADVAGATAFTKTATGSTTSVGASWAYTLKGAAVTATSGPSGETLTSALNRVAGTTGLDAQGAANVWAGTTGKDLLGALNAKNGTSGVGLNKVLNSLALTTALDAQGAADALLA